MTENILQMFIMTCCRTCSRTPCAGALSYISRERCSLYNKWKKLSEGEQALLFMEAAAEETIFLEDLIDD